MRMIFASPTLATHWRKLDIARKADDPRSKLVERGSR